ncbi:MAG TPA: DUF3570 domain-containing protein [Marinagarivorans sp.]
MTKHSKTTKPASRLMALSAAAVALPGVSGNVQAAMPTETTIGYRYTSYSESSLGAGDVASGDRGRYDIKVNQWSLLTPVGANWSFALTLQDETLSGASPWYVQPKSLEGNVNDYNTPQVVMSGASPGSEDGNLIGIDEHRTDGSVASTYYYNGGSISGNLAFSTEDDYESVSFGLSTEREFDNKQTVVAAGFSYSDDSIFYEDINRTYRLNTSDPLPDDAGKTNTSFFVSASRILGPNSVVLGGFSFASIEGHLSDAYKKFDKRPNEKEAYTINLSYRHYVKSIKGSWHFDYRYYDDTWGVTSNTLSVALYKNWEKLQIVPSMRYYGQTAASFYDVYSLYRKDGIPAAENNGVDYAKWNYFSDDARLSDYAAFAFGFKVVFKQKPVDWILGVEYYTADEEFLPGNSDYLAHPAMLQYTRFTFGVDHRF